MASACNGFVGQRLSSRLEGAKLLFQWQPGGRRYRHAQRRQTIRLARLGGSRGGDFGSGLGCRHRLGARFRRHRCRLRKDNARHRCQERKSNDLHQVLSHSHSLCSTIVTKVRVTFGSKNSGWQHPGQRWSRGRPSLASGVFRVGHQFQIVTTANALSKTVSLPVPPQTSYPFGGEGTPSRCFREWPGEGPLSIRQHRSRRSDRDRKKSLGRSSPLDKGVLPAETQTWQVCCGRNPEELPVAMKQQASVCWLRLPGRRSFHRRGRARAGLAAPQRAADYLGRLGALPGLLRPKADAHSQPRSTGRGRKTLQPLLHQRAGLFLGTLVADDRLEPVHAP